MVNKRRCNDFIGVSLSLLIILLSEYYYVPIRKKISCAVEFEVTQSICLQCCWECRTQWSQRSRPVREIADSDEQHR